MSTTTPEVDLDVTPDGVDDAPSADTPDEVEGDLFPRAYVEELREESRTRRQEAQSARTEADEAAATLLTTQQRLHALLVGATGRLADPDDLPFDAAHLDDGAALEASIADLLARKPHLASRRTRGDVGQGVGEPAAPFSLAEQLAARV